MTHRVGPFDRTRTLALVLGLVVGTDLSAQLSAGSTSVANASACEGRRVSRVVVTQGRRRLPRLPSPGEDQVDLMLASAQSRLEPLLMGRPTRVAAIRPFVLLEPGMWCTEFRRTESERLLRLQPYIADAAVRAVPDGAGSVAVVVEVLDDFSFDGDLGLRGVVPNRVELLDRNVLGWGRTVAVRWADGRAARDEWGVRFSQPYVMGRPVAAAFAAQRTSFGHVAATTLRQQFLTDLQWNAWELSALDDRELVRFRRPDGDDAAVRVHRSGLEGAWVARSGRGEERYFTGAVLGWEHIVPQSELLLVDGDGSLRPFEPLRGAVQSQRAWTTSVLLGVRRLRFLKVRGFDAIEGPQDVGVGAQLVGRAGVAIRDPMLGRFQLEHFVGGGSPDGYLAWQGRVDRDQVAPSRWATLASGRVAWYLRPASSRTGIVSLDYASAAADAVPLQLTLDDPVSPVRGFHGSRAVGGQRVVLRSEVRQQIPWPGRNVALAVAGWGDAGMLKAGRVPFGTDATRLSVGTSVLASLPRESRTQLRVDIAYPLSADADARGLQFRVGLVTVGRQFWRESRQLAQAYRTTPPSAIFQWP